MLKANHNSASVDKAFFWAQGLIYAFLLTLVFREGLLHMIGRWSGEDFSYCYLMPPVIFYLLWEKKKDLKTTPSRPSWVGIMVVLLGISLYWLGELGGEYFTQYFAWWVTLVGICLAHMGWKKVKLIAFALLMIPAMFPLPSFILFPLSLKLKLLSSQIGTALMQLYGLTAFRQGNVIDLGFAKLQVVDACNGIRYLFPMFILGILLAYNFSMAFWKKIVLVLSTFPIVMFSNSLRIAITGVLYQHLGATVAEGFFHDFAGWFIFMCSLAVLVGEIWLLKRWFPDKKSGRRSSARVHGGNSEPSRTIAHNGNSLERETSVVQGEISASQGKRGTAKGKWVSLFSPPQFVFTVILLSATLVFSQGVEFREKIPIQKSLNEFPLHIGDWRGKRQRMDVDILNELDLNDYLIADYVNARKREVNLYVAYYESQRKGASIHSPASCLPGSGWEFKERDRVEIQVSEQNRMPVNRVLIERSGSKEISYYWFVMRGRVLTSNFQIKYYNFWDALTKHRTDGALVRLITPIYDGEKESDAISRMNRFMSSFFPILREYIPE